MPKAFSGVKRWANDGFGSEEDESKAQKIREYAVKPASWWVGFEYGAGPL
jgi:hypothetical protein